MRLVELEDQLKAEIEEKGVQDQSIYNTIYRLSFYYLRHKKAITSTEDTETVAHFMAEELYMKIYNGGQIHSWLGYISKMYKGSIKSWRKMNSSEIIDVGANSDLEDAIVNMCMSSSNGLADYQHIYDKSYLDSIMTVINRVLEDSIYPEYTRTYINARLSLVFSILQGRLVLYSIDKKDMNYIRLLYNRVKEMIVRNVRALSAGNDNCLPGNLTALQLFTLGNADMEVE